jgi:hypothetical protein
MRSFLKDSEFCNMAPLFIGSTVLIISTQGKVKEMLSTLRGSPQMVLLGRYLRLAGWADVKKNIICQTLVPERKNIQRKRCVFLDTTASVQDLFKFDLFTEDETLEMWHLVVKGVLDNMEVMRHVHNIKTINIVTSSRTHN